MLVMVIKRARGSSLIKFGKRAKMPFTHFELFVAECVEPVHVHEILQLFATCAF